MACACVVRAWSSCSHPSVMLLVPVNEIDSCTDFTGLAAVLAPIPVGAHYNRHALL